MKKSRNRFYHLLISIVVLFFVISLFSLWSSQTGIYRMAGDMCSALTMGIGMTKYMLSNMSLTDFFTPMVKVCMKMMGMERNMMNSHPLYDVLNLVSSFLLILLTALLIGASIILVMLWLPKNKNCSSP